MNMKRMRCLIPVLLIVCSIMTACASGGKDAAGSGTAAGESASGGTALVLPLDQLSQYDGKNGNPAYVAVDGVIYDVTDLPLWKNGEHNGYSAGQDLTDIIKNKSPHGVSKLRGVPIVGQLATGRGSRVYVYLGWFIVFLFVVMTAPVWLRFLNTHLLHLKGDTYFKVIKVLRAVHKPLGGVILAIALIHGYLALGEIRLHTGTLLWTTVAVTAALGFSFYRSKKKALFAWHRVMVLVVICLVILHIVFPNAVYYLLH